MAFHATPAAAQAAMKPGDIGGVGDGLRHDAAGADLGARTVAAQGREHGRRVAAELAAERHLDEGREAGREGLEGSLGLLGAPRLQLHRIHDRAPRVRGIERGHERRVAAHVHAEERAQSPRLARAGLGQVRVGGAGELDEARGRQDEAAEHPRLRRTSPPRVLGDRLVHRQRGRREEAGVVHESGEQGSCGHCLSRPVGPSRGSSRPSGNSRGGGSSHES